MEDHTSVWLPHHCMPWHLQTLASSGILKMERVLKLWKNCLLLHLFWLSPDPRLQFVVEVDVSDVGVGAVFSAELGWWMSSSFCFFVDSFLMQRGTMILETKDCWLLKWHLKNGDTGWREQNNHSLFGPTIKICSIYKQQRDSIQGRLGGYYSLIVSISNFHTDPVPRTQNQMHFQESIVLTNPQKCPPSSSQ